MQIAPSVPGSISSAAPATAPATLYAPIFPQGQGRPSYEQRQYQTPTPGMTTPSELSQNPSEVGDNVSIYDEGEDKIDDYDFIELIAAYNHQARGRQNRWLGRAISPARTSLLNEAEVNDWNLVNVDEMRLKLFNSSSSSKAIMAGFIPFVTASGKRILDVLVLPISFGNLQIHNPDAGKQQKDAIPIRLVFSETGFLTEEQWILVIAEFKAL
ncbi:hypothetical protein BCR33DRAFT_789649 [Rhizoclosmatium globosum]|uniref:Uncharacterized protein n=1 Tax=Rhizoclosmatium globosum TaxID=329046 RepID=A0A1Y2BSS2_9FUNG|nr:hypothetical protein BCR33DRAFT_789649 [Rhizoclosmatium globosum]|eukprot:ORY37687.1 hypothetical protein BCR33DRAFT_789649 [Rhizoclosmatium globosum]